MKNNNFRQRLGKYEYKCKITRWQSRFLEYLKTLEIIITLCQII